MVVVLKVALVGYAGVGKTRLFTQWCTNQRGEPPLKRNRSNRGPECDGILISHHVAIEMWDLPDIQPKTKLFGDSRKTDKKKIQALEGAHVVVIVCENRAGVVQTTTLRQLATLRREISARAFPGGEAVCFVLLINRVGDVSVDDSYFDRWCKEKCMSGWAEIPIGTGGQDALETLRYVASIGVQVYETRNSLPAGRTADLVSSTAKRRRAIRERMQSNGTSMAQTTSVASGTGSEANLRSLNGDGGVETIKDKESKAIQREGKGSGGLPPATSPTSFRISRRDRLSRLSKSHKSCIRRQSSLPSVSPPNNFSPPLSSERKGRSIRARKRQSGQHLRIPSSNSSRTPTPPLIPGRTGSLRSTGSTRTSGTATWNPTVKTSSSTQVSLALEAVLDAASAPDATAVPEESPAQSPTPLGSGRGKRSESNSSSTTSSSRSHPEKVPKGENPWVAGGEKLEGGGSKVPPIAYGGLPWGRGERFGGIVRGKEKAKASTSAKLLPNEPNVKNRKSIRPIQTMDSIFSRSYCKLPSGHQTVGNVRRTTSEIYSPSTKKSPRIPRHSSETIQTSSRRHKRLNGVKNGSSSRYSPLRQTSMQVRKISGSEKDSKTNRSKKQMNRKKSIDSHFKYTIKKEKDDLGIEGNGGVFRSSSTPKSALGKVRERKGNSEENTGVRANRQKYALVEFLRAQWLRVVGSRSSDRNTDPKSVRASFQQFTYLLTSFKNPAWISMRERLFTTCGGSVATCHGATFDGYKSLIVSLVHGTELQRARALFRIYDKNGRGSFGYEEAREVYETFFMTSRPVMKMLDMGENPRAIKDRIRPHLNFALHQMFTAVDPGNTGRITLQAFCVGLREGKILPIHAFDKNKKTRGGKTLVPRSFHPDMPACRSP
ncbi:hypothetical protein AAMO2058_000578800 [Amorphochlora amoebiformis]